MNKPKLLTIFGTRPEAIKLAPLVRALSVDSEIESRTCVTGQHKDLLEQVIRIFELSVSYDLEIMRHKQDLFSITDLTIRGLRPIVESYSPDAIIVHGDTTTAFASALTGFYMRVPVIHIEAGLRTYDNQAPYPEEFNRRAISGIAAWHMAPTKLNKESLIKEGIDSSKIAVTGNTVIDALLYASNKLDGDSRLKDDVRRKILAFTKVDIFCKKYILITGHRRENFGKRFEEVCAAVRELSKKYPAVYFVYPVHLNPNVQEPVNRHLGGVGNIILVPPLGYLEFIFLLRSCHLVLTDSGGVQEEAPSLGKPVLVMRSGTERVEGINAGSVTLVGTNRERIVNSVSTILESDIDPGLIAASNPYGDGKASQRILKFIRNEIFNRG